MEWGGDGVDGALQGAVCEHGGGTNLQAVGPSRLLARALFLLLLRRTGLLSVRGAEGMWDSCPRAALVRRFPQAGASCLCRTPMDLLPLYAMTISCILVSIFFFLAIQTSISLFCNVSVCESSCCGCCVLPFSARLLGDALSRVTILALPRLGGYR